MSAIQHRVTEKKGVRVLTAYFDSHENPLRTALGTHPQFDRILAGLEAGDESVYDLFDVQTGINNRLLELSDRITYDGGSLRFDGDALNDALSQQIVRFVEQGSTDYKPLVLFMERLATNPSKHSRENLYRWLKAEDVSITMDGLIVAYKGVQALEDKTGFRSVHKGPAFVDGTAVNGHVPNNPGSVITMPRSEVTENPAVGCHVGLHVGTWEYASTFGHGTTLEVHVDPRDVVSVPTDCKDQKMRVCRYKVIQVIGQKYENTVVIPAEDYASTWEGDVGYSVP